MVFNFISPPPSPRITDKFLVGAHGNHLYKRLVGVLDILTYLTYLRTAVVGLLERLVDGHDVGTRSGQ